MMSGAGYLKNPAECPCLQAWGSKAGGPPGCKGHDSTKRCRFLAEQTDSLGMEQQRASVRKTYKYQLLPTPAQKRALATVVWRCRELYNAGLQERKATWERCHVSVRFAMQSAQLLAIKEVRPEYRDLSAQVLQDVTRRALMSG